MQYKTAEVLIDAGAARSPAGFSSSMIDLLEQPSVDPLLAFKTPTRWDRMVEFSPYELEITRKFTVRASV
ncbi:hypothetical protein EVAR_66041_1 [Eumeta japonica]|uniref:Uncharacterized protein n=1 Tax=Eumeta variegata TaxID=151549 RepID=A0A4C1ZXJ9_EUMVA|nr:hypothetical protein EVAR_66041_1 [Eumeta japonica]